MEWNLRQRLAKAEEQRRLAAGLPPRQTDDEPELDELPEPVATTPLDDLLIDLRDPASILTYVPEQPVVAPDRADELVPSSARSSLPVWQGQPPRFDPAGYPLERGGRRGTTLTATRPSTSSVAPTGPLPMRGRSTTLPPDSQVASKRPTKDRCPNCGGTVRIDMFDLVEAVAHLSCTDCGFIYTAKSPNV